MKHLNLRKVGELAALMLFAVSANANTVLKFDVSEFLATPTTNRQVVIQPMSPFPGNLIYLPLTDTNGLCYYTNPVPTLFNGYIAAPPSKITFQIYVTSTNLGLVDAYSLLATGAASTYPAGQTAWAISTSDARYALSGSTASNTFYPLFSNPSNYASLEQVTNISASANTNVYVPGALLTASTNGGTITFNATTQTNASFASTNYVNAATNGLLSTITNIASTLDVSVTNALGTASGLSAFVNTNRFATTNQLLVTSNALQSQITGGAVTAAQATNIAAFQASLVTNGQTSIVYSNPASFQPASGNLSNYATLPTNSYIASDLASGFQPANSNLTNYSLLSTNTFYPSSNPSNFITKVETTNLIISATNGLASTNYVNNATNNLLSTITNIAILFSGTASNAIANNNGFGTNTVLTNAIYIQVTNLYAANLVLTNNTISSISSTGYVLAVQGIPAVQLGYEAGRNGHFILGTMSNTIGGGVFGDSPDTLLKDRGVGIIGGDWNVNNDQQGGNMYYQYIIGGVSNLLYSGNRGSNVMIIGGAKSSLTSFGGLNGGQLENSSIIFSRDSVITNVAIAQTSIGNHILVSKNSSIFAGGAYSNNVILAGDAVTITNAKGVLAIGGGVTVSNNNVVAISAGGTLLNSTANAQMLLQFTNGVAINTNNAGTNGLRVAGNIDSSVGFSVQGIPITAAGITAATATNIAAYQAQLATNGMTSIVYVNTNRFATTNQLSITSNGIVVQIIASTNGMTPMVYMPTNAYYDTANRSNFITKAESTNLVTAATNNLLPTVTNAINANIFTALVLTNTITTNGYTISLQTGSGDMRFVRKGLSGDDLDINSNGITTGTANAVAVIGGTVKATNFAAIGNLTNFARTTNLVGVMGGSVAVRGTYFWNAAGFYTNANGASNVYLAPAWFLQKSGTSYYSGPSANGPFTNIIAGSSPAPASDFGYTNDASGGIITGPLNIANEINSTNLTWQITNAIATSQFGVSTKMAATDGTSVNQTIINPTITNWNGTVLSSTITTDRGYNVAGAGITAVNGNYWLSVTNSGNNGAGFAIFTNENNSVFSLVLNDFYNPGWNLETNLEDFYYDNFGSGNALDAWEVVNGVGPAPTVIAATRQITNNSTATPIIESYTNAILFVDSTATLPGVRGNKERPFKTLDAAQAASKSGDTYKIAPGLYNLAFNFTPTNAIIEASAGAVINYTTQPADARNYSNPYFQPVGSCTLSGGVWSNAYWSGGSVFQLISVTNFRASNAKFYGYAFVSSDNGTFTLSSNLVADFDSCFIQGSDYQTIMQKGQTTNTYVRYINCTFQPCSLVGGFGGPGYGSSPERQVLNFYNMRALVSGCVFDWSFQTNTTTAASLSNCVSIVAYTNSTVWIGNNTFISTPIGGTNGSAVTTNASGGTFVVLDTSSVAAVTNVAFATNAWYATNAIGATNLLGGIANASAITNLGPMLQAANNSTNIWTATGTNLTLQVITTNGAGVAQTNYQMLGNNVSGNLVRYVNYLGQTTYVLTTNGTGAVTNDGGNIYGLSLTIGTNGGFVVDKNGVLTLNSPGAQGKITAGNGDILYLSGGDSTHGILFQMGGSDKAWLQANDFSPRIGTMNLGGVQAWSNAVFSGIASTTNGIASYATNATLVVQATGITNTLSVNVTILDFTGTSVTQGWPNGATANRGTITTAKDITLQPNAYLTGTGCSALGTHAW